MKHLFFVRHGLSEFGKAGRRAGAGTETPLAPEGHTQAHRAGEHARLLRIDHVVSSPQKRAHQTALIIAGRLGVPEKDITVNSLFVERHFGELEGSTWSPDLNIDGFADVETTDTLLHRMHIAYEFLQSLPYNNILVVSHGSTGRALRHIIHPEIPFHSPSFENGKIVQLL
jgi:broad specificity phosphatase PhoE